MSKSFRKFLAVFLLLVTVENILQPSITYALTLGPIQPEYTSYEQPGSTDMVNLMTGDFTFSLPILEVPGPEGSFPLPLTYNAGIGLDQEASWVGLGWTMNAGAISRTITGFPDDANGEAQSITVQNLTGMHGWDASFNVVVASGMFGWNNLEGSYGALGVLGLLNGQWSNKGWSAGVIGVNVFGTDPNFNGAQFATGLITIASMGLAYEASIRLPTAPIQTAKAAVDALGTASIITGFAQSLASGLTSPNAPTDGYFPYSKEESGFNLGVFSYSQYKIWLDQTRVEEMYGMMYLGNAPTQTYSDPSGSPVGLNLKIGNAARTLKSFIRTAGTSNQGAASDINYMPSSNPNKEFYQVNNPALLAPDHFGVKAPGISGNIQPYRLEIGSVAMPREMTANHDRLAPVTFMTNDASYKVPFVYRGQLSNRYYHHAGSASGPVVPSMNTINYGINTLVNTPTTPSITFDLNDVIFETVRKDPSIPVNNKIPQANYVEWLSNDEIRNGITYPSKFIDFLSGGSSVSTTSDRYLFRTKNAGNGLNTTSTTTYFNSTAIPVPASFINNLTPPATVDLYFTFYNDQASHDAGVGGIDVPLTGQTVNAINTGNNTFSIGTVLTSYTGKYADIQIVETNASVIPTGFGSPNAIGGFCITGSNGVTYHFALPIHDYNQYSEVHDVSDPANKKTIIRRNPAFANTWTLTGITGPDFVDRGGPGNAANGIIDDNDWGYWVKFNYGLHTNQYQWRTPYGNNNFRQEYQVSGAPTFESYSQGNSQLIYLNSIETRSHVALFLKGQRVDGKGQNGVLPMRLEEIALVTKDTYNQMIANGLPQFSNKISNLSLSSMSTAARTILNANCIKRIIFNYNYSLCNLVPNSSSGKLTLSSVSILGRNGVHTLPDYKFEYANNPNYDANLWDGWGAYNNSNGAMSSSQHSTYQALADVNGAAWSLTKITNPIGSEININYERDTYSTISGSNIDGQRFDFNSPNATYRYPTDFPLRTISLNHNGQLNVGDRVRFAANVSYACYNGSTGAIKSSGVQNISTDFRIAAVGTNSATFDGDFFGGCGSMSSGDYIIFSSFAGSVYKYYDAKKGEGIRVASIVTKNEFGAQRKIRYLYTLDGVISSGVVAQEPIHIGTPSEIPGYPNTPVIYGQVTVLSGNLTTDSDYYSKEVYQFETPDPNHYKLSQRDVYNGELALTTGNTLTSFENKIEDRSGKIGSLKSVNTYGNGSVQSSQIVYTDQLLNTGSNSYQGIYTSGVLMFDRVSISQSFPNPPLKKHKTNRTTVIQYPYTTYKVINTNDGFSTENTNLSWDLITAAPDQTLQKSPLGLYVKNVNVPAYRVYSELGAKAYDLNNRNMLSQSSASYSYKSNMNASEISLISGSVQTWRKDWSNYRYYDGTSAYTESPEETLSSTNRVWRKGPSYVWKGSFAKLISDKVNDGTFTFSPLVDLFPSSQSDPLWQYTGEITRFDHYGMALESKDLNNIYSSTKLGYDNRVVIAQASNANYNEIAFSSAEDEIAGIGYFGGEVAKGSGTVVRKSQGSDAHTGDCSLSLSSGYGFVFKPSNLAASRTYRISAWANSINGRLYYKSSGSDVLSSAPTQQGKAGWYLMTLEIPANTSFTEVGVKSASGTVLFDDFRFQPKDAAMTCNVYYPLDYQYTAGTPSVYYTLGNDNLYTKYETSEDGKSNKVYMESIKYGGEKLVSEKKTNLRRFNTNQ